MTTSHLSAFMSIDRSQLSTCNTSFCHYAFPPGTTQVPVNGEMFLSTLTPRGTAVHPLAITFSVPITSRTLSWSPFHTNLKRSQPGTAHGP